MTILYAKNAIVARDIDGNNQFIGVVGEEQDILKVYDEQQYGRLESILRGIEKMVIHLESMSGEKITDRDIEI